MEREATPPSDEAAKPLPPERERPPRPDPAREDYLARIEADWNREAYEVGRWLVR